MKKFLLFIATAVISMGASAHDVKGLKVQKQLNKIAVAQKASVKKNLKKDLNLTAVKQQVATPMSKDVKRQAIKTLTKDGYPEVNVRRPGNVLWGGFMTDKAAYSSYYPLVACSAWTPLTFGTDMDSKAEGAEYWLGVPMYFPEMEAIDWLDNEAGEDMTTIFQDGLGSEDDGFYPMPFAVATLNDKETEAYLAKADGEYPALLLSGLPNALENMSYGNYDTHWDGINYGPNYYNTNAAIPGTDAMWAQVGATNFCMHEIIETYNAPDAPLNITGTSLNCVVMSSKCGEVLSVICPITWAEDGTPIPDYENIFAISSLTNGPTSSGNWDLFHFTELKDSEGNLLEDGVIIPAGQEFAVVFTPADELTQLAPLFMVNGQRFPGERHAYAYFTCTYNGKEVGIIDDCNSGWGSSEDDTKYQMGWLCGLDVEMPWLYFGEKEDLKQNFDTAGGQVEFIATTYYSFGDWTEVYSADGTELPSWLTYEMANYADPENPEEWNGYSSITFTVAENTGVARGCHVIVKTTPTTSVEFEISQDGTNGPWVDAISTVIADGVDVAAPAFNLMGQKISANSKGIIIQNGKKFLNK